MSCCCLRQAQARHVTGVPKATALPLPLGQHSPRAAAGALHPQPPAPRTESASQPGMGRFCCQMLLHPLEEKSTSFLSLTGAVFLYINPEYHRPRRGRHVPGGPGAAGFALERRGGERHGAVVGQPVRAAERGRSLPGAQEFGLLAGVDGGVHVVRVVP